MALSVVQIQNVTRGRTVAERAEVARDFVARGRGLLGRNGLPVGAGLVIIPEWSIHMFFMRFPIDVLFIDREHRVLAVREALPPWAPFAGVAPWRGHYVIELPVGAIRSSQTAPGDVLEMTPPL
jgi:uncharacterized membrane protein (UPF0127 family)